MYGDTNHDCVFDVVDVRRASLQLVGASSSAIPTAYEGAALCPWQRAQLDPTLDGAFKQNDAVYLELAVAKKYRFLDGRATTASAPTQRGSTAGNSTAVSEIYFSLRHRLPRIRHSYKNAGV